MVSGSFLIESLPWSFLTFFLFVFFFLSFLLVDILLSHFFAPCIYFFAVAFKSLFHVFQL